MQLESKFISLAKPKIDWGTKDPQATLGSRQSFDKWMNIAW
jgi:hypothetical protein